MVRLVSGFASLSLLPLALAAASDAFIKETLDMHNAARAQHGAEPLTWDPKLAEYAEQHAQNCKFEHTHGPYGECLAAGTAMTMTQAVDMWMAEAPKYSPSVGFSMQSGHFTQVVWKSTQRVGCALITTCTGSQLGLARRDTNETETVEFQPGTPDDDETDEADESETEAQLAQTGSSVKGERHRPGRHRHGHGHGRKHKPRHGRRPHKAHHHHHHKHSPAASAAPIDDPEVPTHHKHKHSPAASAAPINDPVKGADNGGAPEDSDANETPDLGTPTTTTEGTGWGYIMCEYDPPGNYIGQFTLEVQI